MSLGSLIVRVRKALTLTDIFFVVSDGPGRGDKAPRVAPSDGKASAVSLRIRFLFPVLSSVSSFSNTRVLTVTPLSTVAKTTSGMSVSSSSIEEQEIWGPGPSLSLLQLRAEIFSPRSSLSSRSRRTLAHSGCDNWQRCPLLLLGPA